MRKHLLTLSSLMMIALGAGAAEWDQFDDGDYRYQVTKENDDEKTVAVIRYTGTETKITIPSSATNNGITYVVNDLKSQPFKSSNVTSVTLPNTFTRISGGAFAESKNLEEIIIPETVTSIGSSAFAWCGQIKNFKIAKEISEINPGAFLDCKSLTEFTVDPANTSFTTIDGNLYNIEKDYLIQYCIGKDAKSFTIPEGVKYVASMSFAYSALESVTIPEGVLQLENGAFMDCLNMKNIHLPASLNSLGTNTFARSAIESINVAEANSKLTSIDGVVFSKDKSHLLCCPSGKKGSFSIPESTTVLYSSCFVSSQLSELNIPSSIKIIANGAFTNAEIPSLTIPESVTQVDGAFSGCKATEIKLYASITGLPSSLFSGCSQLKHVDLPKSLEWMGSSCFYGTPIESIDIPENVTEIGNSCFNSCSKLKNVKFNDKLETIHPYAFRFCPLIEEIVLPETTTSVGTNAFANDSSLVRAIMPGLKEIGTWTFWACTSLTKVNLGQLEGLMAGVFGYCSDLKVITIPEGVTNFGGENFSNCISLKRVISLNTTPPQASEGDFENVPEDAILVVPTEAKEAYAAADGWSRFGNNIKTLDEVSIEEISVDMNREFEVFNLSGVKLTAPFDHLPSGVYILRQGNKSMKVAK